MTNPYRALCAELIDALDSGIPAGRIRMSPLADRARALLAQPVAQEEDCPGCEGTPVASNSPCAVCGRAVLAKWSHPAPQPETNAFAIVQQRLEQLAGDQELMIYRWPLREDWGIEHTNPSSSVQLGEVSGE